MSHVKTLFAAMAILSATAMQAQSTARENNPAIEQHNPLVMEWDNVRQAPPFNLIQVKDYVPAMEHAIKIARQEVDAIIKQRSTPDFQNTIEALEQSSMLVGRISSIFFNLNEAESTPEMNAVAAQLIPMLTQFSNDIALNEELFKRIKHVYDQRDQLELTSEQYILLEKSYKGFARNGANLSLADKEKYRALSNELSTLSQKFKENELAATNAFTLHITKESDLAGLPEAIREAAAHKAASKEKKGWIFDLSYPSMGPFMKYSEQRDLRKKMFLAYNTRAVSAPYSNQEVLVRIANLRLEMAQLLGYNTYADYVLEENMAEKAQTVNSFLKDLISVSMPYAQTEIKQLQEYARSQGLRGELQRWDASYYSEKLREEQYSINDELLKPYFELNKTRDGIFLLANKLYGLRFERNSELPVYHQDVEVYDVFEANGLYLSTLYLDLYARPSKRGGAWMTSFRDQYIGPDGYDVRPLISLVLNFAPPVDNKPVLLTFNDFTTFLHEFGHALHGMLSKCQYTSVSGTSVPRDFVELPSQIMENWGTQKAFLDLFAVHYQTGEKIPQNLIDKIIAAENFQAGYSSMRQLMFGSLDMAWHSITEPVKANALAFEQEVTSPMELFPVLKGCGMSPAFSHIFSGGYAAGYYGYKWAEVLDADAFALFKEKGIFDRNTARAFQEFILSKGGSRKPMELYIQFRGREPQMNALLERSGLRK